MNQTSTVPVEQCTLLSGGFANFIQIILGFIALSVLIFKRYTEKPMRPAKVWAFDASKQAIGAGFAHIANLAIAILLYALENREQTHADECAFYFINFTLDTTVGILLNYGLVRLLIIVARKRSWSSLETPGDYGKHTYVRAWLLQLLSWIVIVLISKLIIAGFIYSIQNDLGRLAEWLFRPLVNHPKVELVIVMVACPCLMNAMQFWIQDNFLKKDVTKSAAVKKTESPVPIDTEIPQPSDDLDSMEDKQDSNQIIRESESTVYV